MNRLPTRFTLLTSMIAILIASTASRTIATAQDKPAGKPRVKLTKAGTTAAVGSSWQVVYGLIGKGFAKTAFPLDPHDEAAELIILNADDTYTQYWRTYDLAADAYTLRKSVYSATGRQECPEGDRSVNWKIESTTASDAKRGAANTILPGKIESPAMSGAPADRLSLLVYRADATSVECDPAFPTSNSDKTEHQYYVHMPLMTEAALTSKGNRVYTVSSLEASGTDPDATTKEYPVSTVAGTHEITFINTTATMPAKLLITVNSQTVEYDVAFPAFEVDPAMPDYRPGWMPVDLTRPLTEADRARTGVTPKAASRDGQMHRAAMMKWGDLTGGMKFDMGPERREKAPRPRSFDPKKSVENMLFTMDPWSSERFVKQRLASALLPGLRFPSVFSPKVFGK